MDLAASRRTRMSYSECGLSRIIYASRQWRGVPTPDPWDEAQPGARTYWNIAAFGKAETLDRIGKDGFVLTSGHYVGVEEQEKGEAFAENHRRLLGELEEHFVEGGRPAQEIRCRLGNLVDAY